MNSGSTVWRSLTTLWVIVSLLLAAQSCTDRNPLYVGDDASPAVDSSEGADLAIDDASVPVDGSLPDPDVTTPDTGCAVGTVRFELTVHLGGRPDSYCHDSCDTWLRIRTAAGDPVQLPGPMDCSPSCTDCLPRPCPGFSCEPSPIPSSGLQRRWEGELVVASTCGTGVHCAERTCATAGHYVALMCAGRNMAHPSLDSCLPSMPATCVEVPFDLPAPGTVVRGVLPAVK